jgi:hypothetical protein
MPREIHRQGVYRMRIRMAAAAVVGALAAWLVLAAAGGAKGPATASPATTFHLVEVDHSFHFVDNPPLGGLKRPPSQGDTFVFSSRLVTKSGKPAGWLYANCSVVQGGKEDVNQCLGTFSLAGGQLIASATVRGDLNGPTQIAILGGTKAYAGMRGTVLSVPQGKDSNRSNDTFTLFR